MPGGTQEGAWKSQRRKPEDRESFEVPEDARRRREESERTK